MDQIIWLGPPFRYGVLRLVLRDLDMREPLVAWLNEICKSAGIGYRKTNTDSLYSRVDVSNLWAV